MKNFIFLLLFLFSSLSPNFSATTTPTRVEGIQPLTEVVYVTKTGKKFHKSSCRYLKSSKIKTTKAEAKDAGYTACKVCKP
ncbi:hypothetical protein [Mesonia sp. K4-1]|uniref:hypothetical protein n=1 Tax=Mesonia sp. K4-1 TaxID=2602760 RepID=UPI0011C99297|nr:hypothetical protein [Mesonia sp. K4-1]TXK77864.1 hypothetical protein FT986_03965 [Mesonia sp. K4-1]